MSQQELLKRVVQVLDDLKIDYMLTGSMVSSLQGEPRSTHDIDIVVHMNANSINALFAAFPASDFYLSEQAIQDALNHRTMFNLLDTARGDKVDFWILTDEPFDQSRFHRKRFVEVLGLRFAISTPEDTILMKLRWAELSGGSVRQFNDALGVYEMQREILDLDYLNVWAKRLGVEASWGRLLSAATPI
jgi:hypothetical protein